MFGKPLIKTSASLTDVEFIAFTAGYAINDLKEEHVKSYRTTKLDLGLQMVKLPSFVAPRF